MATGGKTGGPPVAKRDGPPVGVIGGPKVGRLLNAPLSHPIPPVNRICAALIFRSLGGDEAGWRWAVDGSPEKSRGKSLPFWVYSNKNNYE